MKTKFQTLQERVAAIVSKTYVFSISVNIEKYSLRRC